MKNQLDNSVVIRIHMLLKTHTRYGKFKLIAGLLKQEFLHLSDIPIDQLSERVRYYHRVGIKQCKKKPSV